MRTMLRVRNLHLINRSHSDWLRKLGILDLTAIALGSSVAFGSYVVLPSAARDAAGPSVALSTLLAFVCAIIVVFGKLPAVFVGVSMLVDYILMASYIGKEWSSHARFLFNHSLRATGNITSEQLHDPFVDYIAMIALCVASLLSLLSIRVIGVITLVQGAVSLLIVTSSILVGFFYADSKNWLHSGYFGGGSSGVFTGAGIILFAFVSIEIFSCVVEESNNYQRNLPGITPVAVIFTSTLFFFSGTALTLSSSFHKLPRDVVLPIVFGQISVPASRYILSVGSVCGLSATLLNSLIPCSRLICCMADDRLLPKGLTCRTKAHGVPAAALALVWFFATCCTFIPLPAFLLLLASGFLFRCMLVVMCGLLTRYSPSWSGIHQESVMYAHMNTSKTTRSYSYVGSDGSVYSATGEPWDDADEQFYSNVQPAENASNGYDTDDRKGVSGTQSLSKVVEVNTDAETSFTEPNTGHDCCASPCSPNDSHDFRAHAFKRDVPDVPYYNSFADVDRTHSDSLASLHSNVWYRVKVLTSVYAILCGTLGLLVVLGENEFSHGNYWLAAAACVLTILFLILIVLMSRLPQDNHTVLRKKVAASPYLSLIVLPFLSAIFSLTCNSIFWIKFSASMFLALIVYCTYGIHLGEDPDSSSNVTIGRHLTDEAEDVEIITNPTASL